LDGKGDQEDKERKSKGGPHGKKRKQETDRGKEVGVNTPLGQKKKKETRKNQTLLGGNMTGKGKKKRRIAEKWKPMESRQEAP